MQQQGCQRCDPSTDGFTWRCGNGKCRKTHHMHWDQWNQEYPGALLLIPCPSCKTTNGIRKPGPAIIAGIVVSQRAYTAQLVDAPTELRQAAGGNGRK